MILLPLLGPALLATILASVQWRWVMNCLFFFLPVAGAFQHWFPDYEWMVLVKDFLFVLPIYLGFCLAYHHNRRQIPVPRAVGWVLFAFGAIVLAYCFHPGCPTLLTTAVGVKVWLFYIPLLLLGSAAIGCRTHLRMVFRILIVVMWVPCAIGVLQWGASLWLGYQTVMTYFYGLEASAATQGFTTFEVGGLLMRIPSTFSFPTQYYNYLLCATACAYAGRQLGAARRWHRFATVSLILAVLASILSGVRAAFLFTPALLCLMYILNRRTSRLLKIGGVCSLLGGLALFISGIELPSLGSYMIDLTLHYSRSNTLAYAVAPLSESLVGHGTGTATGAIRYVLDISDRQMPESYFGKASYEFGVPGLLAVTAVFVVLVQAGFAVHRRLRSGELRTVSAALLGLIVTIAVYSLKGAFLDFDPLNVLFWFLSGVLLKLPFLENGSSAPYVMRRVRVMSGRTPLAVFGHA